MQCALCMRRYGSMRRHTARAKPVRVAFNSPGFHEIDGMALVKRWKADGHMKPVGRDDCPHALTLVVCIDVVVCCLNQS